MGGQMPFLLTPSCSTSMISLHANKKSKVAPRKITQIKQHKSNKQRSKGTECINYKLNSIPIKSFDTNMLLSNQAKQRNHVHSSTVSTHRSNISQSDEQHENERYHHNNQENAIPLTQRGSNRRQSLEKKLKQIVTRWESQERVK